MLLLNENANLLPGMHLPVLSNRSSDCESDFECNGSSLVPFSSPLLTSTPIRTGSDHLVVGSPVNESFEVSDNSSSFNYMTGVQRRPRRVIYTDSVQIRMCSMHRVHLIGRTDV